MPTEKPDTSKGFRPLLTLGQDTIRPAIDCIRADGRLDAAILSPALQQILYRTSRVRNIVSSMLIEGERVELDRAIEVLDSGRATSPNERAVLQISTVYAGIANRRFIPLTARGLRAAHRACFEGVLRDDIAGRFKDQPNAIVDPSSGRIVFIPTPPERVESELSSLFAWIAENRYRLPPPVVAAVAFAELQGIHPFADGNGRIGRLVNTSLLAELGMRNAVMIPLDFRFYQSRHKYYRFLASTNFGIRYDLWVRYFVGELRHAYRLAVSRSDLRPILDRFNGKATRLVLSWVLSGSGSWFQHGDVPNPAGLSVPAITQALRKLRSEGILEAEGNRRGRRYRLRVGYLTEHSR
jgi:Fic family protein